LALRVGDGDVDVDVVDADLKRWPLLGRLRGENCGAGEGEEKDPAAPLFFGSESIKSTFTDGVSH
jgi:hypothetical protein